MTRTLVTGASGFLGSHVVPLLLAAGHEVHGVTTREQGVAEGVTWHRADLHDPDAARALVEATEPQRLLHLAWYTEHGSFWGSLENLPWVEASVRLWREFAAAGGERALLVGSCAEYEWGQAVLSELRSPCRPASLYGACKNAVREVVEAASPAAGVSTAWARVFFVYGPEEHSERLVASVARALIAGREAPISTGEQVRDFIHVADAAAAIASVLDAGIEGPVNIGSGEGARVREVAETLGRLSGRPELIKLGAVPRRTPAHGEGDPESVVADTSRLRHELGWRPTLTLEAGLSETLAALRDAAG